LNPCPCERGWGNIWFPTFSEAVYPFRGDRMAWHPPRGDSVPYGERTDGAHRFPSPPPKAARKLA